MEQKINEVKENFKTNIDSLEQKYNILNSQMEKFTKIIEEDKINKEKNKIKNEFEFKELEQDIKKMLSKQREYMKSYIDDYTKRIDNILINHSEEIKEENYVVKENINNLKNYMVNEINNVNNKIIEENEENIKKTDLKDDNTNSMDSSEDILKTIGANKNKINESKEEDEKSINLGGEINNKADNIKNENENDFFDDDFEGLNFGSTDFFNTIFEKDDKRENDVESYEEMDYNNYDNPFGNQLFNSLYENPFCTKEKKGNLDELLKK